MHLWQETVEAKSSHWWGETSVSDKAGRSGVWEQTGEWGITGVAVSCDCPHLRDRPGQRGWA